ncbi:PREDICTED: GRIP and coiled-coil domain-containing protein 1 [Papilio polytes]|uniref:GRIP and coiled-coil domain-containing protein 1 n=1 Tax=Papilio polytes TaxID=76194 RepID=UPI0006767BE5|nr:PREDICTED: GRIP and coiled-coil domain-containing protein 1 [Papilio polytes]
MESLSKQELISTITKQADQIKRYEARLRDVVAAYKGLVKEKEALEISLKALSKEDNASGQDSENSVSTLMQSLATLTAEKSRMEEAFQADKKVTREKYENMLASMREETKTLVQQHLAEVSNLKAKIAYEIQERENERADHAAMMKELHVKLTSERKTKEKLEDKVVNTTEAQVVSNVRAASQAELEKRVRDLSSSLQASQRRLQRAEARTVETPALLVRLQQKLALLEQSHSIAIREEQIKAKRAEESARKICARQEERVALLEGKLAELSQTIGEYDVRRRRDQQTIQQLKESLNGSLLDKMATRRDEAQQKSETDNEKLADTEYLQTLIDKIHILKKELNSENIKLGNPVDITTVFKVDGYDNIHDKCREELEKLKLEFENYKTQNMQRSRDDEVSEIDVLKTEIMVLKEKVDTYKLMWEEEKQDKEDTLKLYEEKLERERSCGAAALYAQKEDISPSYACRVQEGSAPPHMLHYAHELARKDLDISQLRKDKHLLEGQYRDCQREATIEKERFKEVIRTLKEEIDRLRRIQSREGANLEYLKNVVMAYLVSRDAAGRRHMVNAIAAVLHLSAAETAAARAAL